MPSAIGSAESTSSPKEFNIPTVDISAYLVDPSSQASQDLIQQVAEACVTTGFFQLVGHGIPRELQQDVFAGSAAFFDLPSEEKKKLDKSHSVGSSNRGYEILGNQALQEGTLPDLKEGFYVGQEIPLEDPRVQAHAFLMGPNLWPPSSMVPEHVFKKPMQEYWQQMFSLSLKVMEILAHGLPYGPHVFDEFVSNDAVASIRLLHYPPQKASSEIQLGAGAHTDFGAITLLLQDHNRGLQVWDGEGERWVDVEPNPDAYVVNVGDMLSRWTSGRYKSSLHRVINQSTKDRYSVPFFFDGNIACELWPLDGSKVEGPVLTVESHMKERFTTTYGRAKTTIK